MPKMSAICHLLTPFYKTQNEHALTLTLTHDPKQPHCPKSATTLLLALGTMCDFHPLNSGRWIKAQKDS